MTHRGLERIECTAANERMKPQNEVPKTKTVCWVRAGFS